MSFAPIVTLAWKSLLNRRATAGLSILAIAVSVALLLGVEKVRTEARASFANTISGTDLIVGARGGPTQLLLYSVFRIGNATNNISWRSYQEVASRPGVAWAIPLSLGDSHRGYRVLGTSPAYFEHYRYGRKRPLEFSAGDPFADVFDAVLGADVADQLGYQLGDPLIVAHGLGAEGFQTHDNQPFRVAGIIRKTGTPVDRTVHVSLEGIEAMHVDWQSGAPIPGAETSAEKIRTMDLRPQAITAALIGLESKFAVFGLQRWVNDYRREPLTAILPGVALQELWDLMGTAEAALAAISGFVVASGILSMLIMLLAGLGARRREMAILRSVGARSGHIFGLLIAEAMFLTLIGAAFGILLLYVLLFVARPLIDAEFGLFIAITPLTPREFTLIGAVIGAGFLAGAIPAIKASRQSLADGLVLRI